MTRTVRTWLVVAALAALAGIGVNVAWALNCTTTCIGNICYTNCY
jgi:hypothetical protein